MKQTEILSVLMYILAYGDAPDSEIAAELKMSEEDVRKAKNELENDNRTR